jgi:hypothetical protein
MNQDYGGAQEADPFAGDPLAGLKEVVAGCERQT